MKIAGLLGVVLIITASLFTGFSFLPSGSKAQYTPHEPISINGNEDFALQAANESWPGDGTEGNPYIIERYEFNGSSSQNPRVYTYIEIKNTNVHFIIRNVSIFNNNYFNYGISFNEVVNGSIENVDVNGWIHGMNFWRSSNITIADSSMIDSYIGMKIAYCINFSLYNNNFQGNGIRFSGFELEHFNSHTITEDNHVNDKPILYYKNKENFVVNNISNGELIFVNCSKLKVENLIINNSENGVQLIYVNDVTLYNNTIISNNGNGIDIYESSNVNISSNNISANMKSGITIDSSRNIIISKNEILSNDDGLTIDQSDNVSVIQNNVSLYWGYAISLQGNNNITIKDNLFFDEPPDPYDFWDYSSRCEVHISTSTNVNIYNNYFKSGGIIISEDSLGQHSSIDISPDNLINDKPIYYYKNHIGLEIKNMNMGQLILFNCTNITITNLTISGSYIGLQTLYVNDIQIINTSVFYTGSRAMLLKFSNNIYIKYCNISNNSFGIVLCISDNLTLENNSFISNSRNAIDIEGAKNITISSNDLINNYIGINLLNSKETVIINNTVNSNSNCGICIGPSSNTTIINNIISNNSVGIEAEQHSYGYYSNGFYFEDERTITNLSILKNSISDNIRSGIRSDNVHLISIHNNNISNSSYGIDFESSEYANIFENILLNNSKGIYFYSSSHNSIYNNNVQDNSKGIYLRDSDQNTIFENNLSSNNYGIYILSVSLNNISSNHFSHNIFGIYLDISNANNISENNLSHNTHGIYFDFSIANNISKNNFSFNKYGITSKFSKDNLIYHNHFLNNTNQMQQSNGNNLWNNSQGEGNFWSDYVGFDTDGDGVGETDIPHLGVDNYPLTDNYKKIENKSDLIIWDTFTVLMILLMILLLLIIFNLIRRINKPVSSEIETKDLDEK